MRALILSHVYPRFKGDNCAPFLHTWAQALGDQGHKVFVLAPHDGGTEEAGSLDFIPIRRVRYGTDDLEQIAYKGQMHELVKKPSGLLQLSSLSLAMAYAIRRAVKQLKPDVLHVHWWMPSMVWAYASRVDIPIVCHLHGTDIALLEKNPALIKLARTVLSKAHRIEAVSTNLAARAEELLDRDIKSINPMPLSKQFLYDKQPEADIIDLDKATILGVGRLIESKGYRDLIVAMSKISQPARLRLVGSGPEKEALQNLAKRLGVELQLAGSVDPKKMPKEYAKADIFVHPSYAEGLGMAVAEALCAHKPVIATNSGGVGDLLEECQMVPVGDTNSMAKKIDDFLIDPPLELGHRGARKIQMMLDPVGAAKRTAKGWQHAISAYNEG